MNRPTSRNRGILENWPFASRVGDIDEESKHIGIHILQKSENLNAQTTKFYVHDKVRFWALFKTSKHVNKL